MGYLFAEMDVYFGRHGKPIFISQTTKARRNDLWKSQPIAGVDRLSDK